MFKTKDTITNKKITDLFLTADLLESENRDIQRYINFVKTCFNNKLYFLLVKQYKELLEQLWANDNLIDLVVSINQEPESINIELNLKTLNGKSKTEDFNAVEKRLFKNITTTLQAAKLEVFFDGVARAMIDRFSEADKQYYIECQTEKKKPTKEEANAFYLVFLFNQQAVEIVEE